MYIPPFAIQPTKVLAGALAVYENVWENPQKTISELEEVTTDLTNDIRFARATTLGSNELEINSKRTNSHLFLNIHAEKNEKLRVINNRYFDLIVSAMRSYQSTIAGDSPFYFGEGFNVLKYQTGQEYKAHYDGGTESRRAFSPILYLNDDYTGGEIEFVNFGITIKPEPGTLMLFPSNYAYSHIAHPVKTGTKYAIVTWLHDQAPQNR
jgi:hypothetical protein